MNHHQFLDKRFKNHNSHSQRKEKKKKGKEMKKKKKRSNDRNRVKPSQLLRVHLLFFYFFFIFFHFLFSFLESNFPFCLQRKRQSSERKSSSVFIFKYLKHLRDPQNYRNESFFFCFRDGSLAKDNKPSTKKSKKKIPLFCEAKTTKHTLLSFFLKKYFN